MLTGLLLDSRFTSVDEDCNWLMAVLFHTLTKNYPNKTLSKI